MEEKALNRFKGQYLKPDKVKRTKPKGNELHRINYSMYSHNGKIPNRGGCL